MNKQTYLKNDKHIQIHNEFVQFPDSSLCIPL